MRSILLFSGVIEMLCACGQQGAKPAVAPVHTETVGRETELLRLTLTPQAQQRLGIATVRVGADSAAARRETSGEIVVPAGAGGVPTGSLSNVAQIGAAQVAAEGEIARARAQARLARVALGRAEALVREEAGSVRARDEAAAALATAQAAVDAALAQRRLLGPAVGAMANMASVWVRVPVFGTDMGSVERSRAVEVRPLGGDGPPRAARPVQAPPSANALAGTVDLYYALDNRDGAYRVGQRVAIALPLAGRAQSGLAVPISAIVTDIYGGDWVYQRTAPDSFVRRRIEIASTANGRAILSRGLTRGDEIVTVAAPELFGTEFGVAH
ncbi:efflux RND transporter periplasmic adaptor subunit [Sphingomonas sp. GB1N7]|uniref:efflux RND transporter periplasmic adaptor subunit n=1 Tax=Parasphingomonas caseinilytica TaxID=3096158 RepID=UPI002FC812BA